MILTMLFFGVILTPELLLLYAIAAYVRALSQTHTGRDTDERIRKTIETYKRH